MTNAVVLFIDSVDKANMVVENGIVVNQTLVPATPATRVKVSNVPLFIGDEMLTIELSRHGKVVSGVKVSSGCKSPLLRHVVSHKRTLYMLLNQKNEDLNVVFKVRVDGFDYLVLPVWEGGTSKQSMSREDLYHSQPRGAQLGSSKEVKKGQIESRRVWRVRGANVEYSW
ncbi:uncharacterized protein ACO6RY_08075 [Pungitius sinensis]